MWVAMAGIALAVYSAYRYNSADGTPDQIRSQRAQWNPYIYAGVGAAMAAPAAAATPATGAAATPAAAGVFGSTAPGAAAAAQAAGAATATYTAPVMTGAQTAAMSATVTASSVPPVVAATAPATIAGPATVASAGMGYEAANLVQGEAPQETWFQKTMGRSGKEKSNISDWLDDIGTPQQNRQEDEIIEQPPASSVDYQTIAMEQERREEEWTGQQEPVPEGRHGERRWDDWTHNDWWGV